MKIITRHGEEAARINPITEGKAPDFTLPDQKGREVSLSDFDKPVVLSIFPNINTRVCAFQTRHFNQEASENENIEFLSISNNTREEQKNWCAAEGIDMEVLSDEKGDFGRAYGLLMKENGLLARSVYLVDKGQIVYCEILSEMTDEPSYDKLTEAIEKLSDTK